MEETKVTKGPVLIELSDDATLERPDQAAPVPDLAADPASPQTNLQRAVTRGSASKTSRLGRWILGLALSFVSTLAMIAAYDAVVGMVARVPLLGYAMAALGLGLVVAIVFAVIGELAALSRLSRVSAVQRRANAALADNDLAQARQVTTTLTRLYRNRDDLSWGRQRFEERAGEQFDADALIGLAEAELLSSLDQQAEAEVQAAARQVATVTALVPLALADVLAALTANLRMIRRVAEIYGGRAGTLGSWRLFRSVITHLVATGAVAVGDDLLGSMLGGSVMSKLSRRFGEGLINGALTVRVGVAAMEVCRPLPYTQRKRPSVSQMAGAALGGLFGKGEKTAY
ncbi:MAG: YcjF family protein [Thalassovita mediterranea]|jgi:putative membrane protein|uniref:YcjF family protein n=1 Tax=Thalassovita mediterranea TaxID=340021 RepID=UPI003C41AA8E